MDFFRKGNFQNIFYNDKQYFRTEYTDELSYYEWWSLDPNQKILTKIDDYVIIESLEAIFSTYFSDLKYDPFKE